MKGIVAARLAPHFSRPRESANSMSMEFNDAEKLFEIIFRVLFKKSPKLSVNFINRQRRNP